MSHMFRVDFITHHANGTVETGKVIVLAESHETARDVVCTQLKLPTSRTQVETSKVKPPCYQVESHQSSVHKKPSVRSQRDAPLAPTQRYHLTVTASNVHGQSEQQVMRKVGEELQARGAQTKLRHNIEMSVDCSTGTPQTSSQSPLEKIEMFGARASGRVQGGQVRGK